MLNYLKLNENLNSLTIKSQPMLVFFILLRSKAEIGKNL